MTSTDRQDSRQRLKKARKNLEEARANDDQAQISYAEAKLGLALFDAEKFKDGQSHFRKAEKIAKQLNDFSLEISCLSLKVLAYQISGQFPTAFTTAQKIEEMAVEKEDRALQSDALATQGQILIESGDELSSLEKFNSALDIAEALEDTHRTMKLKGALGHYSLTIASLQQAEAYFGEAVTMARQLGDREAEYGYLGNLGILYNLKGDFDEAIEVFAKILEYMRETVNQELELQVVHRIIGIYSKTGDNQKAIDHCLQGLELARDLADTSIFYFYETLIASLYRLGNIEESNQYYQQAIDTAIEWEARDKEIDLLLGLGESYMLTDNPEQALETYQLALEGSQRLQRLTDHAYLLGRIGVILAELERIDEAISYHQQALKVAKDRGLPELEAEQLVMLAIANQETGKSEKALEFARQSLQIYEEMKQYSEVEKVNQLISELMS